MIKQWLSSSPTLSYVIGLLGVGFSMSSLPMLFRIVIATASLSILIITAGIKLEEYLKKRHQRKIREEVRGIDAFVTYMKEQSGDFGDIDNEDLEQAQEHFEDQ